MGKEADSNPNEVEAINGRWPDAALNRDVSGLTLRKITNQIRESAVFLAVAASSGNRLISPTTGQKAATEYTDNVNARREYVAVRRLMALALALTAPSHYWHARGIKPGTELFILALRAGDTGLMENSSLEQLLPNEIQIFANIPGVLTSVKLLTLYPYELAETDYRIINDQSGGHTLWMDEWLSTAYMNVITAAYKSAESRSWEEKPDPTAQPDDELLTG